MSCAWALGGESAARARALLDAGHGEARGAMADEAVQNYMESLEDLTFNSKPIINSLTMIAEESVEEAAAIVTAIERTIAARPPDKKLPVMYLLDSICKNVGGAFIEQFEHNLPDVVGTTFAASGPKVRNSLQALVRTWSGVFPADVVAAVKNTLQLEAGAAAAAPAGPVALASKPAAASAANARKRGREEPRGGGGGGGGAAQAREEVTTLMTRIQTHMRAGLAADNQLLGFAAKACALYGSILATKYATRTPRLEPTRRALPRAAPSHARPPT